jgi:two-component system OmpR family sensor kinase
MKNRRLSMVLIPLVVGLAAMGMIQYFVRPVPILEIRVDLGNALLLLGILLTLFLLVWQVARSRQAARDQSTLQEDRAKQDAGHRRFLRRLDHQLKNPLTALRAVLVNLSDHIDPSNRQTLQVAEFQAERLGHLVGDLRKLAELEELSLEMIEVDMPGLLNDVIEAIHALPAHESRQIELVFSRVPWSPPPVLGDPDLLSLVFYNLVENALKYSLPNDAVEVRVLDDGHHLTVEVADSGPGIEEEDLPHLFEELFRGANAHGQEGSGLGLALAQRVVQHHKGTISVRSRRQGQKGTVFAVHLPLSR